MKKLVCWQSIIVKCTQTPRFRHCSLVLYCSSGFFPINTFCQNIFQIYSRLQAFPSEPWRATAYEVLFQLNPTQLFITHCSQKMTLPSLCPAAPSCKCHLARSLSALLTYQNHSDPSVCLPLARHHTLIAFSFHLRLLRFLCYKFLHTCSYHDLVTRRKGGWTPLLPLTGPLRSSSWVCKGQKARQDPRKAHCPCSSLP